MKRTITAILLHINFLAFSQQPLKKDTVRIKFSFSIQEVQFIYDAIDKMHGDHVAIKNLLDYISDETNKQIKPQTDSTNKKKP